MVPPRCVAIALARLLIAVLCLWSLAEALLFPDDVRDTDGPRA